MSRASSRPVGGAAVQEAFATVRARAFLVAIVVVIGIVGGAIYGVSKPDAGSSFSMRLQLQPLSENATVISIGVSSAVGPIAADFKNDQVLASLSRTLGISEDKLDEELLVFDVPGDPHQMKLEVPSDGLGVSPRVLLRAWLAAIQVSRHRYIDNVIENSRKAYRQELSQSERTRSRSEIFKTLTRLIGLQGSLKTDVGLLHRPAETSSPSKSPAYYAVAGGLAGLVAGLALALGIGLLDRRLRTPGALSAQFGLPVLADLRDGDGAASVARRLSAAERSGAQTSPLVIVEAGSPGAAAAAAAALGDAVEATITATGEISSDEAQVALRSAGSWLVAVTPGETREDQAAGVTAELAALPSRPLGLVLV